MADRKRSRSPSRSPPRQRKRPGAASRLSVADREAARQRQLQREHEAARTAQQEAASRGVHDVVKQHYNMVPERGREWRQTDSKIKGLRSYNNWVKSSLIQKFIGDDRNLKILDIGCGKGGDLQKWQASRKVDLYVGCDPADVSIKQAKDRYAQMQKKSRRLFHAEFYAKDCFGEWLGDIPIINDVGIDPSVGPGNAMSQRWGGGGWDMVTMMFCMHYAFESEAKAKGMLRNVAGALKKGGRFIGCIPNSDILSTKVMDHHKANGTAPPETNTADEEDDRPAFASDDDDDWDPEKSLDSPKPDENQTHSPKPDENQTHSPKPDENQTHSPKPDENQTHSPKPDKNQTHSPDANQTHPSNAHQTHPSNANQTQPSNANQTQPSNANQTHPSNANQTQPPNAKHNKAGDEREDGEVEDEGFAFGNSIYRVKFPGKTPPDGTFRPPYGWKYFYFLEEAVEAPEYVVPWEAFRALAEDYNLELQYRKPFREVWEEQKDDPELGPLSERMGVRDRRTGQLSTSEEELAAADFYHTFCFYKV